MKVDKLRTVIIYIIIILLGLVCLLPLLNIVAISFSSSAAVEGNMVGLIPVGFSTAAYKKILEDSQFWHSFLISVERVVLALIINFVLIVLMAYPLSKTNAQFRGRNIYANLMIFAMLLSLSEHPDASYLSGHKPQHSLHHQYQSAVSRHQESVEEYNLP